MSGSASAQGLPLASVHLARAEKRDATQAPEFVGDVEPIRRSTVAGREAGAVIDFPHREGEFVKAGEVLARLETDVLERELAAAVGLLDARKEDLNLLKNGTRAEVIDATQAKLRSTEATRRYAKVRFERTTRLSTQNAASIEELDEASAAADRAEAEYDLARAQLAEAKAGPRAEEIAKARSMVASQQAEVDRLKAKLARHKVVAPFDGYIVREHAEVGEWLIEGGPVVDLIDVSSVDVRTMVPARFSGKVTIGMAINIFSDALATAVEGKVFQVVPELDAKSRLFPVKVRVSNNMVDGRPLLKPGMLTSLKVPVGTSDSTVFVPKDSLVLGGETPIVMVARSTPSASQGEPAEAAVPVRVRIGVAAGSYVAVEGDIKPGEWVVVEGNERLQPGQPLRVLSRREAPASAPQ